MADYDMNKVYFPADNVTEVEPMSIYDLHNFVFNHPIIYVVLLMMSNLAIISGNAMYLLAICRNPELRSNLNILIISIAAVDSLDCICISIGVISGKNADFENLNKVTCQY